MLKRSIDIAAVVLLLLVLSPLLIVLWLLVRWKLGAPVLFTQERIGQYQHTFSIYKFRSMTNERGDDGRLLPDEQRLTPFGSFLRKSSLDELPQLFNVLKGDMSLVGPRPLLVQYLPYYTARERKRHAVRPGITGLSQINGRNLLSWEERLELDVQYVEKQSIANDLIILILTAKKVILREGTVVNPNTVMQDLDKERARLLQTN
ncbi:sugar transferase [Paenibacillus marinisediminis]